MAREVTPVCEAFLLAKMRFGGHAPTLSHSATPAATLIAPSTSAVTERNVPLPIATASPSYRVGISVST